MSKNGLGEAGLEKLLPLTRLEADGRISIRHRQVTKQTVVERLHMFERLLCPVVQEESSIDNFVRYINKNWLLSDTNDPDDLRRKRIFRAEDRDEIVSRAIYHRVCDMPECRVSFVGVTKCMSEKMGYCVEASRAKINGKQERYRLIVSFDEAEYTQYQSERKHQFESEELSLQC